MMINDQVILSIDMESMTCIQDKECTYFSYIKC